MSAQGFDSPRSRRGSQRRFPEPDARSVGGDSLMSRKSRRSSEGDPAKNFKVVIRVRPPLPRELNGDKPFRNVIKVHESERVMTISENLAAVAEHGEQHGGPYSTHVFTFDHVYDQNATQKKVYDTTAKGVVDSALLGYNATIFAYGQTGTGKTYTMEGFNSAEERGIIPRAIEQIFHHIQSSVSPRMRFLVRASYLQIYNEDISDLLKPERSNLAIREDKKRGVFVEGLSEWVVRSPQEIYGLMERGGAMRATGSTKMNELSSRSHAVFIIIAEQSETTYVDEKGEDLTPEEFHELVKARGLHGEAGINKLETHVRQSFKVGKLNLVDLAGSERVRLTGATGQRLEESKKINQSLSALGNVIAALTDPRGRQHIPYRDSKLTRILEDSLGGNCKTTMMAMASPALEAFTESLSTLKFANRAKSIKNEARINEDLDQKSLLRKYERELKRLRSELEQRSRNVVDKRRLLELDEQRRRAEEDKMAAIRALEARSLEMMREKAEKRKLEERIHSLTSQMLVGNTDEDEEGGKGGKGGGAGGKGDNADPAVLEQTPQFRAAVKEHQDRIRVEYEQRLADLEKERESMEEEKAQVDRYKQLLLKQRDIMIALTTRLNERDEQIMALQDELDAYDKHQKELEEKLDERTAALIHLQRVVMEYQAVSPVKNPELSQALGDWSGEKDPEARVAAFAASVAAAASASGGRPAVSGASSSGLETPGRGGPASAPPSLPPQMLITHKQYNPYGQSESDVVVYGGQEQSDETTMLSAEEKIRELTRIVDGQKQEQERLGRELEEVQAEKVSMEYLLRERLERLVQSEIEARLAVYRKEDGSTDGAAAATADAARARAQLEEASRELERLRGENERLRSAPGGGGGGDRQAGDSARSADGQGDDRLRRLTQQHTAFRAEMSAKLDERGRALEEAKREVEDLRAKLRTSEHGGGGSGGGSGQEAERLRQELERVRVKQRETEQELFRAHEQSGDSEGLRQRVSTLEKERQAIQTIMEQKIKALVQKVGDASTALVSRGRSPQDAERFNRELQALDRLVSMSISALKNAQRS